MKFLLSLSFFAAIIFLPACTKQQHPPVENSSPILATVNIKDMSVTFIDPNTRETITDWKMTKPYTGGLFLPDGETILLYGKNVKKADHYSLTAGLKKASWNTGAGIVNGKLLEKYDLVAFADQDKGSIRFFNLQGTEIQSITVGENPLTMTVSEHLDQLFVMSFDAEELSVINLKTLKKAGEFAIHPSAVGALIREKENEIWIGGHGRGAQAESDIHIYHLETGELKKKVSAPSMPVNFLERNGNMYILSHGTNTLFKLNGQGKKIGSIQIGANPFEMAWHNNSLVVAGYDSNDLHFVDPVTLTITKTIQVGNGPFKIISGERSGK